MCRRIIDGVAKYNEARGRDLKEKLLDLKSRGIIEARLHEWADHVLRQLGNDAAHDPNVEITKDDANDALEFTKAILEYVYVFDAAFQRFKERRAATSAPETAGVTEGDY